MDQVIAATRGRPDNVVVHERDRLRDQVEALTKQVAALEARTRHHLVLTCDRCRASLTMGSSLAVADVVLSVAMELGAAEAGWQVGHRTAAALGARVLLVKDRDLCPHCVAALAV
jgi:hypothetical protein